MANNNNRKKSSTTKRKTTTKKSTTKPNKVVTNDVTVGFADYFHAFSKTKLFRFIVGFLIFVFAILFNLLLSWNDFDKFFLISGIEIIVGACVYIFILIAGKNKSDNN